MSSATMLPSGPAREGKQLQAALGLLSALNIDDFVAAACKVRETLFSYFAGRGPHGEPKTSELLLKQIELLQKAIELLQKDH